jgi:hypothetical protein
MVTMAAKASDDASRRIRRQKLQRRGEGLPQGRVKALGWINGLTINEEEAAVIREAALDVLAGASLTSISRRWNEQGVKQPQGGKGWTVTSVRIVLTNPRNAGLVSHYGEIVGAGQWPAIIDRETFDRLCSVIESRRQRREQPRRTHLLTGLVRCSECGTKMLRDTQRKQRVWRCRTGDRSPGRSGCGRVSILAEPVEEIVTEALFEAVDTADLAALVTKPSKDETSKVTAELLEVEQRLDEQADLFARGAITARQLERISRSLQAQATALRAQLTSASNSAVLPYVGKVGALRADWKADKLTLEQKRHVLGALVDHVTIKPGGFQKGKYLVHTDRLDITWRV